MVFLGRWILDIGSLDELDSKDKFRFSGSVSSGVVFFQDAFGLQFRFFRILERSVFLDLGRLVFQDLVFWLLVFLDLGSEP